MTALYSLYLGCRVYYFRTAVSLMVFRARLSVDPIAAMARWHPGWIDDALREGVIDDGDAAAINLARFRIEANAAALLPPRKVRDVMWEW